MQPNVSPIERAFQLARLGTFLQVTEIKEQLAREGYFTEAICGPTLHTQLNLAMEAARIARWKNTTTPSVREPAVRRKPKADRLTETQLEKMSLKKLVALQAKIKAAINEQRLAGCSPVGAQINGPSIAIGPLLKEPETLPNIRKVNPS